MQNDVLKNEIAPWQEKGRWYHGVVDPTTPAFITDRTDKYVIDHFTLLTSGQNIYLNPDSNEIIGLDSIIKISADFARSSTNVLNKYYATSTQKQLVLCSPTGTAGTCEFWAFIVEV